MVKSGLRIFGCADVDIDKLELNFIFRLRVSVRVMVGVRVRVSISIYLIDVIELRIGRVLTNNIRKSAVRFLPIAVVTCIRYVHNIMETCYVVCVILGVTM